MPLSLTARSLLSYIDHLDGYEVHKDDPPEGLGELEDAGLVVRYGARGPDRAWQRALLTKAGIIALYGPSNT